MIAPERIVTALFETFDKSSIIDFRRSLSKSPRVKKWMIAADYCLHDRDRPNDAYAFTIIPYDAYPNVLNAEINSALPRDMKRTRDIKDDAIAFLSHPRRFHIGFILPEPPAVFYNGRGTEPLSVARESIAITVDFMEMTGRDEDTIRRVRALKQASQARNFNVELLADLYLMSWLYCFVTLLLCRERSIDVLGWFSDRDNMTTWCDGVVWDFGAETLWGLGEKLGIRLPKNAPLIAVPTPNALENAMWYEEFVRLPDYIAGILAAWNFEANKIPGDKTKYRRLAEDLMGDARNMAILKIRYNDSFQPSRIKFERSP